MPDPTIPRHRSTGYRGPTYGVFERLPSGVMLRSRNGTRWPIDRVTILQGSWGYTHEGVEKLPRAEVVDDGGQVVIRGDRVIIDYLEGDYRRPLVRGGVRAMSADEFLARNHASPGANANRLRVRIAPLDDEGNESGAVQVQIAGEDKGTFELQATDGVRVEVGPIDKPVAWFEVASDGTVTVHGTSIKLGEAAAQRIVKGDAFRAFFNTHTHTSPVGPTGPPQPLMPTTTLSTLSKTGG